MVNETQTNNIQLSNTPNTYRLSILLLLGISVSVVFSVG